MTNGSFGTVLVNAGAWTPFATIDEWQSLNGERLEFWGIGHSGCQASNGDALPEIDHNGGASLDGLYQDIRAAIGQT
ncbi:MAG: hypothetical protein AAGA70_00990 [Pseudomonadota bacterium]